MEEYAAGHNPHDSVEFYDGDPSTGFSTKQRTPMKFTSFDCTIALVMRNRFHEGMIPGDPKGPYMERDWVFTSYDVLLAKARQTADTCKTLRRGRGSPGWDAEGELSLICVHTVLTPSCVLEQ